MKKKPLSTIRTFGESIKIPTSTDMAIIGIDPGEKSGAITTITFTNSKQYTSVEYFQSVLQTRNHLIRLSKTFGPDNTIIFLESPKGLPFVPSPMCPACKQRRSRQGMGSTISFFKHVGQLEGILVGRKHHLITPQQWQKRLGCLTKGDKHVSQNAAQARYPQLKVTLKNADSILIAHYGCLFQLGEK